MSEAAVEAWPYAVASTNAYVGDDDLFADIGPTLRKLDRLDIAEEDANKGFGYELFERIEPVNAAIGADFEFRTGEYRVVERIIAFRGTDFDGFTDIFYGTLRNDQIEIAIKSFESERKRFSDDIPWVVTGHSLGGALATEVSIKYPKVRAYMFNTSPFYGGEDMVNDMQRMVFNERGEVLRRFARYDEAPAAEVFTINCGPRNGTFTKHKVRPLADCITWIAAYHDESAYTVVSVNVVPKPMVECGPDDKLHPGTGFRQLEPCVHVGRRKSDKDSR